MFFSASSTVFRCRSRRARKPQAGLNVRSRVLTGRGWSVLLAGAICLWAAYRWGWPALSYVGMFLGALVIFSVLVAFVPRRRGTVTRVVGSDLFTVGAQSHVQVRLTLRRVAATISPPVARWEDSLPPLVEGDACGELPRFPDRSRTDPALVLPYTVRGVRRGSSTLGPLTLTSTDPFGLVCRRIKVGEARTITVVPEVVPLSVLHAQGGGTGSDARAAAHRLGQSTDDLVPRPYVPGDSMRRVHWRASAHRGELMVRQEEHESSPEAWVMLDVNADHWPRPAMLAPGDPDRAFEHAVTACASMAVHLNQEGYRVSVVDNSGSLLGTLDGSDVERDALLVALSSVAPRPARGSTTAAPDAASGPVVVITGTIDADSAEQFAHRRAAAPLLFATGATPDAFDVVTARGWCTAALGDDPAEAWQTALSSATVRHTAPARSIR